MARLTCEANLKGHSDDLDNRLLVPSACVPLYYVGDWRPEPVYSANSSSRYRENVNVQFIQVACEKCAQAEWQLFKATRYLRRTKRSTVERVRMRTVKCETSIFLTMTLFQGKAQPRPRFVLRFLFTIKAGCLFLHNIYIAITRNTTNYHHDDC